MATNDEKLPSRRGYRKPPTFLKAGERDRLIASVSDVRDKAIVALFCFGGLRLNELCMLDRDDVDFDERTVMIRFAKGGKWRQVRLHPTPAKAIHAYLATRTDADPALFLSQRRKRIARRTVEGMLDRYIEPMDFGRRVTPHCLRHTFGVSLMKSSRNIRIVQRALGHSSIQTTTIYTAIADDELYDAMDAL
jgi:site-specific recombinase XerC